MTSLTFLLIGTPHSEAFQKVEQDIKQLKYPKQTVAG